MENKIDEKVKPGIDLSNGNIVGAVWIPIRSIEYFVDHNPVYELRTSTRLGHRRVIANTLAMMKKVEEVVREDTPNIVKCMEFVREKFPHATFFQCSDAISVHDLTQDEMIACLSQEGITFNYALEDKNGKLIIPEDEDR
jgi:hypothetical protein